MKQNIGKELRIIRKYRGLTLRELGKKTGISYSRLGKFEGGKEMPTNEAVSKIGRVLNVNIEDYLETSREIDIMFNEFLDSLFYCDDNNDLFKTKIANGKINSISFSFGKAQLITYMMCILESKFEKASIMESELFEYFKGNYECEALIYQYKGLIYRMKKYYDKAIECFVRAEMMTINRKNKGMLYYHSSIVYKDIGNLAKAMQYIEEAHRIFSEYGSLRRVAYCFIEYGLLLKSNNQYEQAISQFNIALRALEMVDCSEALYAKVYRNMCWTMILAGDYKRGLEYLEEAKEIEPKHGFTVLYAIWCNYKLQNYQEAERWIEANIDLYNNVEYGSFYELFDLLVKCREGVPSAKSVKLVTKIIEDFKQGEEYERVNFYIDIALDLLNRSGNELEKIKYLEMKVNLTKGRLFVSTQDI